MSKEMTREEARLVANRIDNEGFHYCFESYSTFPDIEDPEFHKLREYYLQHAKLLNEYVRKRAK